MTDRTGLRVRQARTPVRTCVGCRRTDSRSALLRVVAIAGDEGHPLLAADPAHRMPGRGAWLHPSSDCFEQAVRRKAFVRALRLTSGPDARPVAAHLDTLTQAPVIRQQADQPKAGQTLMSTR